MSIRNFVSKYPHWVLMLVTGFMVLAFQGSRGLLEPDEGRYSNVALQILQHDDWISLYRNQESLHFTKPPLTYWAIAASVSVFGHNEWAVRLPMALAFLLSVWLTYQLGRSFVPKRPWLPALFLLGAPVPFLASNTVNTDGVLSAMLTLAMACYVKSRFAGGSPRWLDAMWLAFGLAFLTKGPPALLPLAVVVVFEFWQGTPKSLLRPLGLAAFALVGFTWYGLVIQRHPGLLDYFLGHEVYDRIATGVHKRNSEWYGAFKIYVPVFVLGLLPWLSVLAKQKWTGAAVTAPLAKEQARFLWLWLLLPLAVFFLSQSRMYLYVLGLFVPACLLLAHRLQDWRIGTGSRIGIALWLLLLLAVKGLAPSLLEHHGKDSRQFAEHIRPMLPGHPEQIIFVEDMTRNGLNLYLNTNIKRVSYQHKHNPPPDSAYDSTLAKELMRPAQRRLFIMKRESEALFLAETASAGYRPVKLGEWQERITDAQRDRMIYTLQGEFEGQPTN